MNAAQQREIVRADRARRLARQLDEDIEIFGPPKASENHAGKLLVRSDARAMGCVTALTTRASRSSWLDKNGQLRGRVVGIAPGTEDTSDGTPTVLVTHADGRSEVLPANGFGRKVNRKSAPRQTAAADMPEMAQAKYGIHNLTGE